MPTRWLCGSNDATGRAAGAYMIGRNAAMYTRSVRPCHSTSVDGSPGVSVVLWDHRRPGGPSEYRSHEEGATLSSEMHFGSCR